MTPWLVLSGSACLADSGKLTAAGGKVVDAIAKMDTNKITPEKAELLKNDFLPTDEEKELIKERKEAGSKLAPLDIFLDTLAGVERVRPRLTLIILMDTCGEALARIAPASMSVMVASNALMASTKLAKILEVILAFGNRMNSNRRGGAWGFKLSAFDRLIDTKTNDRKRTLMHFVCSTVQKTELEAAAFASELVDINAAAAVSLQDLKNQLAQAQRTIAQVATELEKDPENESMKAFQTECVFQWLPCFWNWTLRFACIERLALLAAAAVAIRRG